MMAVRMVRMMAVVLVPPSSTLESWFLLLLFRFSVLPLFYAGITKTPGVYAVITKTPEVVGHRLVMLAIQAAPLVVLVSRAEDVVADLLLRRRKCHCVQQAGMVCRAPFKALAAVPDAKLAACWAGQHTCILKCA